MSDQVITVRCAIFFGPLSGSRGYSQIDITDIVPTIRVPTLVIHRTQDVTINVEAGRYLAFARGTRFPHILNRPRA
jgi:hypothetical protein